MALARALAIGPAVLLLDEQFGALDARGRRDLRPWLRRLHEPPVVTTVLVTHVHEEAMEIGDRIAVMDHAQIRQVAAPRELDDGPSRPFVMELFGTVDRVGDAVVRPRDVKLRRPGDGTQVTARIERLVHRGFAVRADGDVLMADLTADEVHDLGLIVGGIVAVNWRRERVYFRRRRNPNRTSAIRRTPVSALPAVECVLFASRAVSSSPACCWCRARRRSHR